MVALFGEPAERFGHGALLADVGPQGWRLEGWLKDNSTSALSSVSWSDQAGSKQPQAPATTGRR